MGEQLQAVHILEEEAAGAIFANASQPSVNLIPGREESLAILSLPWKKL